MDLKEHIYTDRNLLLHLIAHFQVSVPCVETGIVLC
jgi:hypothetical protein